MKQLLIFITLVFAGNAQASPAIDTNAVVSVFIQAMNLQDQYPDSAFALAQHGLHLSLESNYTKGEGMAYMRFASIFNAKGQNDSALFYYREALRIRLQLQDYKAASAVWRELSYVYSETGKNDSAFYCLFEALRLNRQMPDSMELGRIYFDLGSRNISYKEKKSALTFLKKAEQIFASLHNTLHLSKAWSGLGNYYFSNKEYNRALRYFLLADSSNTLLDNGVELARSKNNLALCYENLGQYGRAEKHFEEAAGLYTSFDMQNSLALLYANMGNHFILVKNADKALFYLKKGKALAEQTGDPEKVKLCYELLSDAEALKGNFGMAYQYHLLYTELSDSLLNAEKISSIAEMQTKYETEKKEQQISLLDEQARTRAAQRNFFIAGSLVLLLLLFVLGFYYQQKQRIAKKNQQIADQKIESLLNEQEIKTYNAMIDGQEEERKRIATDLHDRLGSMLSTVKLLFGALDNKIDKTQEDNKQQYEGIHTLLDEAVSEVRKISHNLSTGMVMSFGLVAALEELCNSINKSGLIHCRLLVYGMQERPEQQTEIGIYRIIQELLSNILKHARAEQVSIQLKQQAELLTVIVEDDGIGFNVEEKKLKGGLGLKNLEARAAGLKGVYQVISKPGAGTISTIHISVI